MFVTVKIDSSCLDEALEKAARLNAALREARSLILDLAGLSKLEPLCQTGIDLGKMDGDQTSFMQPGTEGR